MTFRGLLTVVSVEWAKLAQQLKVRIVILVCAIGPFAFAGAMRGQASVPADTLFGSSVTDSGFAIPLVVLGFAGLWALPVLASVVGGDLFSAEDRYGTWTTILTRSRSRTELFVGKVATAFAFSLLALFALAASSVIAGILLIGAQPLVDLSGMLLSPRDALVRVVLAWSSVVPSVLAFTALAVLASVWTQSSAAGIGLPVVAGLALQLLTLIDGPEAIRRLLITSGFSAWHGFLSEPSYYGPIVHALVVSTVYLIGCLIVAHRVLRRRDIGR